MCTPCMGNEVAIRACFAVVGSAFVHDVQQLCHGLVKLADRREKPCVFAAASLTGADHLLCLQVSAEY